MLKNVVILKDSYSSCIVTMAISSIICSFPRQSEISVENYNFFIPLVMHSSSALQTYDKRSDGKVISTAEHLLHNAR